jgi:hypothetical protein
MTKSKKKKKKLLKFTPLRFQRLRVSIVQIYSWRIYVALKKKLNKLLIPPVERDFK